MKRPTIEPEQKALEINLDDKIYGTFSEIGAGQEVARYFFQAGAAAGTIAKTMSAYDKIYSDEIYGPEPSGRYVCESRIYKMLDHEYDLMENRLQNERPETKFFVFADTIAALNFHRTIKGDGWIGLRFQLSPRGDTNDIVLHVKMLDNDTLLQQQAVGILGTNLIYACYKYASDPELLVQSLMDSLKGRIAIDMIRLTGPDFPDLDNRWLSLLLVKHGLSDVAIFDSNKKNQHASEFLYRKSVLVVRGSFRPPTLVNQDMISKCWEQFRNEEEVDPKKAYLLTEITLDNLRNSNKEIDVKDFLDRADLLCAMGLTVAITNCEEHEKLLKYLSDYKAPKIGLGIGVRELEKLINIKYDNNNNGRIIASFGDLFTSIVKMYVYPMMQQGSSEMITANNLPTPEAVRFLYQHLLETGQIVDVQNFDTEVMHIFSKEVFKLIQADSGDWESMVPNKVAKVIKEQYLFGFPSEKMEFKY
jgi:hypothetical protein